MKQFIIFRKDLTKMDIPVGKLMGQASHAAVSAAKKADPLDIEEWEKNGEAKIILSVKGETQLINLAKKLEDQGFKISKIIDEARTVFDKPTFTCIGIGPIEDENLTNITKKLQLL